MEFGSADPERRGRRTCRVVCRPSRDDLERLVITRIPRTSVQYYEVPISSPNVPDPTSLPVAFAFTADLSPPPTPATAGSWVVRDDVEYARVTVGGTATTATVKLAPGVWHAWVRVDGSTEDPVLRTGLVVID